MPGLKLSRQHYYRWLRRPVTAAELAEAWRAIALVDAHRDDPEFGRGFTSWVFTQKIRSSGLLPSFGTVGDGLDNAMMESFWSSMQVELLDRRKWRTRTELANAIFEYIEVFYNLTYPCCSPDRCSNLSRSRGRSGIVRCHPDNHRDATTRPGAHHVRAKGRAAMAVAVAAVPEHRGGVRALHPVIRTTEYTPQARRYADRVAPRIRPDLDDVPAYVPGKGAPGAVKLASNEITAGPLPSVLARMTSILGSVNRYPDNGAVALRDELAKLTGVTPENVHVGCGSVAICQMLVQISCLPGDEVLMAWRSFESYPLAARVAGAIPVQVPLDAHHAHDLDAMAAAITDRTRLIFVCNPNNPTGTTVSRGDLIDFLTKVPPEVMVALDEAYFEYHRDNDVSGPRIDGIELFREFPNVVVLRTFSKAYGLAGLRVGYAVADPSVVEALSKVHIPFSVNSAAQAAAIASLNAGDELLARTEGVVAERARVRDTLLAAGYDVPPTQANFVWLVLGDESTDFAADAAAAKLLVRAFAGDGVRVTVTDPSENDAFLAFATKWRGR